MTIEIAVLSRPGAPVWHASGASKTLAKTRCCACPPLDRLNPLKVFVENTAGIRLMRTQPNP